MVNLLRTLGRAAQPDDRASGFVISTAHSYLLDVIDAPTRTRPLIDRSACINLLSALASRDQESVKVNHASILVATEVMSIPSQL
jgi:hypothetical protein